MDWLHSPTSATLSSMHSTKGDLGYINPALYQIANNAAQYANDFHDVTTGNNQANPSISGYSASQGWDAVTGLGTPDAANLLPDLIAAT